MAPTPSPPPFRTPVRITRGITIGKKLNALIVALLIPGIGGAVVLATQLFTSDFSSHLKTDTMDTSAIIAGRVRTEIKHVADHARVLGAASLEQFQYEEDRIRFIQENLAVVPQFLGQTVYKREEGTGPFTAQWRVTRPVGQVGGHRAISPEEFKTLDSVYPFDFAAIEKGSADFRVGQLPSGTPILRMGIPFVQKPDATFSQLIGVEILLDPLTALFAESSGSLSFLVDRTGKVLASSDADQMPPGQEINTSPIFALMRSQSGATSARTDYLDAAGEKQMAAFHRVGFADLAVVTQVPQSAAHVQEQVFYQRTAELAATFVFLALAVGFVFSRSLTQPILQLATAAAKVKEGDLTVRLPSKKGAGGDEIQRFSETFNEMVSGLAERDRIRDTFAKFHSKEVAEKILAGELKLGGERMNALVFFSDVRGFTAMSERLNPEALVSILNRYMTRMVHVILKHNGIVDKYVGDAIMAVWGAPLPRPGDAENAVRACLEMRRSLAELNEELKAEGLPVLKIGMGLNRGPLVAGNIGSDLRMEYTVIGDTVNTASRIESLTKEFGTDLLISASVLEEIQGKFVAEKAYEAKVKGKEKPLEVFKVHGFVAEDGSKVLVQTPYSEFAPERSDKVVHEEEKAAA